MPAGRFGAVVNHLRGLVRPPPVGGSTDAQLLACFLADGDEGAFAELVRAHGPMVLGLCRRVLGDGAANVDDVFQATFLLLARKAASIRRGESLPSWLYGVALRVAQKSRISDARRRIREKQTMNRRRSDPLEEATRSEVMAILDEELRRLPEKYRAPVVLCYLEGKTNDEAARELGWPAGTIKTRLAQARELLRARLPSRGVAPSSATLGALLACEVLTTPVSATLHSTTVQAALQFAAGNTATTGALAGPAVAMAERTINAMFWNQGKAVALILTLAGLVSGAGWIGFRASFEPGNRPHEELVAAIDPAEPDASKPLLAEVTELGMETDGFVIAQRVPASFWVKINFVNVTGEKLSLAKPGMIAADVRFRDLVWYGEKPAAWPYWTASNGTEWDGVLKPKESKVIYMRGRWEGKAPPGTELKVQIKIEGRFGLLEVEKTTVVQQGPMTKCTCGCDHSHAMLAALRTQEPAAALQAIEIALATIAEQERLGYLTDTMAAHRLRLRQLAAEIRNVSK